jgi:hypothetical protein
VLNHPACDLLRVTELIADLRVSFKTVAVQRTKRILWNSWFPLRCAPRATAFHRGAFFCYCKKAPAEADTLPKPRQQRTITPDQPSGDGDYEDQESKGGYI